MNENRDLTVEEQSGGMPVNGNLSHSSGEPDAPTTPAPSLRDVIDDAVKTSEDNDGEGTGEQDRKRDGHGRFAKGDDTQQNANAEGSDPEGVAAPPPEGQADQQALGQEGNAANLAPDGAQLLARFNAEDRATFDKIPDELKEPVLNWYGRMQADYTRKTQEIAPLRNAFQPYDNYLQQLGVTADQAVSAMMPVETGLRLGTPQEKMQVLRKLALDYGIIEQGQPLNLGLNDSQPQPNNNPYDGLADQPAPAQIDIRNDPNFLAVLDKLNSVENRFQTQEQIQHQKALSERENAINIFVNEKNGDGSLKHAYVNEVMPQMIALAQAKQASGQPVELANLYEEATWSTPSVRDKMLATQKSQTSELTQKQKVERAKNAKKSGSTVSGSPSANGSSKGNTDKNASLKDTISQAYDNASDE